MVTPTLPFRKVVGRAETMLPYVRRSGSPLHNDVYVGTVMFPGWETRGRAYIKIFPLIESNQLILNEVLAYFVAIQCGLPSPLTFPCACDKSMLRQGSPATLSRQDDSPYVLGVASVDGNPKQIRQVVGTSEAVWADILNWPYVARAAVFDELVANDDRHISNLVRYGIANYQLIDHERILFARPWLKDGLEGLREKRCDSNPLADSIAEGSDELMRQRMIHIAQKFILATSFTVPTYSETLEHICNAPSGSIKAAIDLFNERRMLLSYLMQWHIEKGQLFKASSK